MLFIASSHCILTIRLLTFILKFGGDLSGNFGDGLELKRFDLT